MEELALSEAKEEALCRWPRPARTNPQQTAFERAALAHSSEETSGSLGMRHRHWCQPQRCGCDDGRAQERDAVMAKVEKKTSELVGSAIVDKLQPLAARVKTLTFDNGKEFAGHAYVDQQLQSTAYFARPFASWERGSNENLNGLLRQYIPKKRSMSTVSDEEIRMIQNRLNNRPRKRLGFKTPAEVFHQSLKRVALRT